jgi:hypothetical protein
VFLIHVNKMMKQDLEPKPIPYAHMFPRENDSAIEEHLINSKRSEHIKYNKHHENAQREDQGEER